MMMSCAAPARCSTANQPQRCAAPRSDVPKAASHVSMTRRRALLAAGTALVLTGSGQRTARADEEDGPVDALIGTLQKTEEDVRLEATELVKTLLQRSEQNRDRYKKEIQEKYCYRQAEDGIGDCGGLRLIPGATRSGKQVTPGWLKSLFNIQDAE